MQSVRKQMSAFKMVLGLSKYKYHCKVKSVWNFHLEHESEDKDHGNTGHDIGMVLDHELVAEDGRRLARLLSLDRHADGVRGLISEECSAQLQLTN